MTSPSDNSTGAGVDNPNRKSTHGPCSGGTEEARERALAEICRRYGTEIPYTAEQGFADAYDAARAEYGRKVAELEAHVQNLQHDKAQLLVAVDNRDLRVCDKARSELYASAEKAEARVRELEVSRAGVVREYGDAKVEFEAALATERERNAKLVAMCVDWEVAASIHDRSSNESEWPRAAASFAAKAQTFARCAELLRSALSATPPDDDNWSEQDERRWALAHRGGGTPPTVAPEVTQLYRECDQRLPAPPNTPAPEVGPPGKCGVCGCDLAGLDRLRSALQDGRLLVELLRNYVGRDRPVWDKAEAWLKRTEKL